MFRTNSAPFRELSTSRAVQERFSVVTGNYYRNADGFIFVFDMTNRQSFEHIEQWQAQASRESLGPEGSYRTSQGSVAPLARREVLQHHDCGPTTIKILVGNKSDLRDQLVVTEAEVQSGQKHLQSTQRSLPLQNSCCSVDNWKSRSF